MNSKKKKHKIFALTERRLIDSTTKGVSTFESSTGHQC